MTVVEGREPKRNLRNRLATLLPSIHMETRQKESWRMKNMNEIVVRQIDELKKKAEEGVISFGTFWVEVNNIISNYDAQQSH